MAKFAKENARIIGKNREVLAESKRVNISRPQEQVIQNLSGINQGRGKLFSELFNKDGGNSGKTIQPVKESGITIDIADETLAFKDLIGRAALGRCKDIRILRCLDSILADNKVGGVSLSYMGGLSMLLKFDEDEVCANFLLDFSKWKEWFSSLESWDGQSLSFERIARVKIQGIPLQLADNDVLNNIAEHHGKIVHGSNLEAEDDNLSVNRIGLLVGEGGKIQEYVTLRWKNKMFWVWIV
ncbi:hypothetical protein HanPI659440_Chr13g0521241 [Helianthus annuus]|nr:hypothetical protein HanPI659440_Chr13g0521241 [Helianthus annuus]